MQHTQTQPTNIEPIALAGVVKTYGAGENAVHALRSISLRFPKASFTAIMGPSGSGKSTLLQCAAGLDRPTSGSIVIAGKEITKMSENKLTKLRRDYLGFIFQSFNLMPTLTAQQNVALPLRLAGKHPRKADLNQALQQVGLGERVKHLPSQLSGGQQQRVAIARALAANPTVLFADEPTGALDTKTSKEVLTLLRQAVDSQQQTVVMVTHDPVAASYADQVVFLADGQVVGSLGKSTPATIGQYMTQLER